MVILLDLKQNLAVSLTQITIHMFY